jgi:hypothetical protein
MYAGPKYPPLPTREEAIESYWQEVEDRVELAEFGNVDRVDEERVEREFDQMLAGEDRGLYDLEGRVF